MRGKENEAEFTHYKGDICEQNQCKRHQTQIKSARTSRYLSASFHLWRFQAFKPSIF